MALPYVGIDFANLKSSMVRNIEVRVQNTGSFVNIGMVSNTMSCRMDPITKKSDPADSNKATAMRISLSFQGLQTDKTDELPALTGVSGAGLYDTYMEVKFIFPGQRTLILGATVAYPMYLIGAYSTNGTAEEHQHIDYTGEYVQPYDAGLAALFSA